MDEKKSLEDQLASVKADLANAWTQIRWMQTRGGFTDAKTHSMRATRLEERLDKVEIKTEALLDVAGYQVALNEDHLQDRHDADLTRDNAIDVISFRRIRKRLHLMAEKLGLIGKRTDLRQVREDENRLRPRAATS